VTERLTKSGKIELGKHLCVTIDEVKQNIKIFLAHGVNNPDAVRCINYNFGIFTLNPQLGVELFPDPPKPDPLVTNMAIFPMRRHKGWNYNIFNIPNGMFAGIVFDRNRRPYYQTPFASTIEQAIKYVRAMCDLLGKGQCINFGFKLDEGKAIRMKEEQAQTIAAKIRRGKKS